ncbi:MAG: hypothetical protein ACLVAU_13310 [Ruminococcus sp.]
MIHTLREFPFYYQEHIDDNGLFMGYTQTNGLVFLDSFLRNEVPLVI